MSQLVFCISLACFLFGYDVSCVAQKKKTISFEYGKAYTYSECQENYLEFIKYFGIKNGDVIAEVGAASGYNLGGMSVFTDSTSFYVQDIEPHYLNQKEFDKMVGHYSSIRKKSQTNIFQFVIGTERKTNLPDAIFDKIIIYNTFHEFTYINEMIFDIAKKLKPTGKIIVYEGLSYSNRSLILPGCFITAYQEAEIKQLFEKQSLYMTTKIFPGDTEYNIMIFEKDKTKADDYVAKKAKADVYMKKYNFMESDAIFYDSVMVSQFTDTCKLGIKEITSVYPFFEDWINEIGYDMVYQNCFQQAINVFKMNTKLFPVSFNVYDSLGDGYLANKQNKEAMFCFSEALRLNPNSKESKEKLDKLKTETGD